MDRVGSSELCVPMEAIARGEVQLSALGGGFPVPAEHEAWPGGTVEPRVQGSLIWPHGRPVGSVQRARGIHLAQPTLVRAGPGTGKTWMVKQAAYMLAKRLKAASCEHCEGKVLDAKATTSAIAWATANVLLGT